MATLSLEALKETIKALTPLQQRELREWWQEQNINEPITQMTEEEVEQKLFEAGVIRQPPPPITDFSPYQNRQMIQIKGKPLSETVIEERR